MSQIDFDLFGLMSQIDFGWTEIDSVKFDYSDIEVWSQIDFGWVMTDFEDIDLGIDAFLVLILDLMIQMDRSHIVPLFYQLQIHKCLTDCSAFVVFDFDNLGY